MRGNGRISCKVGAVGFARRNACHTCGFCRRRNGRILRKVWVAGFIAGRVLCFLIRVYLLIALLFNL